VLTYRRSPQQRAALAAMSMFGGAYTGARTDSRALKRWNPGLGSANADTIGDLPTLRARSRDLERNSPLAAGAIATATTYTVGTGLWPHPRIDREILGLTDEAADEWERQAARIFTLWDRRADLSRRQTFTGMQDLALRGILGSGDVLVLRRFRERAGDLLGLKLQLVEADRISNPHLSSDTDQLVAGVELDQDGVPRQFHVRSRHPGDLWWIGRDSWTTVPAFGLETGEPMALLVFRQLRPDQCRGVPLLAPVIEPIKELDRYSKAEVSAAVISAFFTVFVKSLNPDAGLGIGNAEEEPLDKRDVELGEGAIANLAPGEDITIANPGRPNAQYEPFFLAVADLIGVGIEMPFEVLLKRFNSSYSASRAAFLDAWRTVTARRVWLVDQLCQPVYEWVIAEAVTRGYLQAPGFFEDPLVRAAWLGAKWVGDSMGQIDPRSETDAAIDKIAAGLSTLEDETAQLNGGDWEKNHAQQVKERKARQRDGLDVEPVAERIRTEPVDSEPNPDQQQDPSRPKPARPPQERQARHAALSGSGPQP
jgi:lambda family phage portal protein